MPTGTRLVTPIPQGQPQGVSHVTEPRRAALYVDFDNVFSSLAALDEWAAWSFAAQPARWLDWLAQAVPTARAASWCGAAT